MLEAELESDLKSAPADGFDEPLSSGLGNAQDHVEERESVVQDVNLSPRLRTKDEAEEWAKAVVAANAKFRVEFVTEQEAIRELAGERLAVNR